MNREWFGVKRVRRAMKKAVRDHKKGKGEYLPLDEFLKKMEEDLK